MLWLLPSVNEVWGKVMFLHLFVILFTGGMSVPLHAGIHPRTPLDTRWHTHTPDIPPLSRNPLLGYYGYGKQAGGKHPTGMQSCCQWIFTVRVDDLTLQLSISANKMIRWTTRRNFHQMPTARSTRVCVSLWTRLNMSGRCAGALYSEVQIEKVWTCLGAGTGWVHICCEEYHGQGSLRWGY